MLRVLKLYRDARTKTLSELESEIAAWPKMRNDTVLDYSIMITRICDLGQYYHLCEKLWKPILRPVHDPLDFLDMHQQFSGHVARVSHALWFCDDHYRFVHRDDFQDVSARAARFFFKHVSRPNAPLLMEGLSSFLRRFRQTGVFGELKIPLWVLDLLLVFRDPELLRLWHDVFLSSLPHSNEWLKESDASQVELRMRRELYLTEYLPHSRVMFPSICHRMVSGLLNRVRLREIVAESGYLTLSALLAHSSHHVWSHLSTTLCEDCTTNGPLSMLLLWDRFVSCAGGQAARNQAPPLVLENMRCLIRQNLSFILRALPGRSEEAAILFRDGGMNQEVVEELARVWWARRENPQTIPELTSLLRVLEPLDSPRSLVWKRLLTELSGEEVVSCPQIRVFCCHDDRFFPSGMWRSGILIGLPLELENARQTWQQDYLQRFPSRRITWGDWVSTVELTNGLRMCLPHYLVLDWIDHNQGSATLCELKNHFQWEAPMIFAVVHSLLHHPVPLLQRQGRSESSPLTEKTKVFLVPTIKPGSTYGLPVVVEKKSKRCEDAAHEKEKTFLLEARIVRIVKRHGPLSETGLDWYLKKSGMGEFSVGMTKKAVARLIQLDYIERDPNGFLSFVP